LIEQRLGVRDLRRLPGNPGQSLLGPAYGCESIHFRAVAALDVVWALQFRNHPRPPSALTCTSVIKQPADSDLDSLVLAHQRAIGQLAGEIAATAQQWIGNSATTCSQWSWH
jgi:hypothetical protein